MENIMISSKDYELTPEDTVQEENHNKREYSSVKRKIEYQIKNLPYEPEDNNEMIFPKYPMNDNNNYEYQLNNEMHNYQISQIPIPYQMNQSRSIINSNIDSKLSQLSYNVKMSNENFNSGPKDNISRAYNRSTVTLENKETFYSSKGNSISQYEKKIPRLLSFQKISPIIGKENFTSNIAINRENYSELVEIPRSDYDSYIGKDIVFVGDGMQTGEYKFTGAKIIMKAKENQKQKIKINEEEINNEINKRINKQKKEKIPKYEVVTKFYATTEFDGKPIKKIVKSEQRKIKYDKRKKHKYHSSQRTKNQKIPQDLKSDEYPTQQENKKIRENKSFIYNNKTLNNRNLNYRYKNDFNILPTDIYSKTLFDLINQIRADPQSFISVIENEKKNIIMDGYGRLIYNGKLKVALNQGEPAFDNAINYLKEINPMEKLEFNQLITVECPENENDILDVNYITYKVDNLINTGIYINSYWRDIINDPEISFLLMIVDDICYKSGKRRKDILNPNMKYIGISSKEINGKFVCFITLSKFL